MEELENEVSNIRSNTVAANSRNIYRNSSTRMLVWLLENKPYLLTEEFISLTSNHLPSQLKITVQSLLDRAPLHEPLKWHLFTAPEFMTWVVSLKKPDGQMWCIGNPINGYPAFKILKPDDLPSKNLRKRLSDLRYLMGRLRDKATEKGLNLDIQTIEQANNIFSAIEDAVALPEFSKSGRKRNRKEQLVWTTVVNLLRNAE